MRGMYEFIHADECRCDTPVVEFILSLSYQDVKDVPFTWEDVRRNKVEDDDDDDDDDDDNENEDDEEDDYEDNVYDEYEPGDIFEWWAVSGLLFRELKSRGEYYIENPWYEDRGWWGRTCTGQSIMLDSVLREIYNDYQKEHSEMWEPINK